MFKKEKNLEAGEGVMLFRMIMSLAKAANISPEEFAKIYHDPKVGATYSAEFTLESVKASILKVERVLWWRTR